MKKFILFILAIFSLSSCALSHQRIKCDFVERPVTIVRVPIDNAGTMLYCLDEEAMNNLSLNYIDIMKCAGLEDK